MDPTDYVMEPYVNDRLGYSFKDVWNLAVKDVVYAGRARQTPPHINNMAGKRSTDHKVQ